MSILSFDIFLLRRHEGSSKMRHFKLKKEGHFDFSFKIKDFFLQFKAREQRSVLFQVVVTKILNQKFH